MGYSCGHGQSQSWVWPEEGGKPFLPPASGLSLPCRFSVRVNSTELFHVDRRVWTTLKGRDGLQGPRERAFHTASVLGNYMVVYGEMVSRTMPSCQGSEPTPS